MTITSDQLHDAMTGEALRFSLNGVEYVLLRSDVYDQIRGVLEADHQELRTRLAESSAADGWDDPGMDTYDSYAANS